MKSESIDWDVLEMHLDELIAKNKQSLLLLGRRIIPTLTAEDILQPNDYPELENHPDFRYDEGVLAGIETVQMMLRALKHM